MSLSWTGVSLSPQPKPVFCQFSVLLFFEELFLLKSMWVLLYERMQQRSSDPLELELKVVLATWVLGTDLGSSGREGSEYS